MAGSSTNRVTSGIRQPPLGSYGVLRRAIGSDKFDDLSQQELSDRVYEGVLLKSNKEVGEHHQGQQYTHKYRVDESLNKSWWIVLAKALWITWGDNSQYWKWTSEGESCYQGPEDVDIAELNRVCWLEMGGTFKTITLSPKTAYQVEIIVKMRPQSRGWEPPVSLSLTLPDGHKQERVEFLGRLEKDQWTPITIGTFETTPRNIGEISFCLTQTGGHWKSGLLVKGVQFRPLRKEIDSNPR